MPGGLGTYTNLSSPTGATALNASPTHAQNHTTLTGFVTDMVANVTRRETYSEVHAADYGVLPSNSASTNGTNLRALLAPSGVGDGKVVVLPVGTIPINVVAHPSHSDYCCVWLTSNTTLVIPMGCTLQVSGSVPSGVHRVVTNYHMSSGTLDSNIRVIGGGTIDGGATTATFSGSTPATRKGTGVTFWNATKCLVDDIHTLDVRGEDANAGEGFTFYCHKSSKVTFRNCTAEGSAAAYAANLAAATGFGDTNSNDVVYLACRVANSQGQGFTTYGSNNVKLLYCTTEKIDNTHFNHEYSRNVVYFGCHAGGRYTSEIDAAPPTTAGVSGSAGAFTYNAVRTAAAVDEVGYKLAYNYGGGDVTIDSCYAGGFTNTTTGGEGAIAIEPNSTNVALTSVTGAGPYTITAAAAVFHGQQIGNYVQLGTNTPVPITGVTSQTVCTTENNPGASGQVYVWGGRTNIRNCTVADSAVGFLIQSSANTTGNNRRVCAVTRIDDLKIRNCTTDMAGVAANASNQGQTLTNAQGGTVITTYQWASGSAWMNTYPFDVEVYMTPTNTPTITNLGGTSASMPANCTMVRLRPGDSVNHTYTTAPVVVARF